MHTPNAGTATAMAPLVGQHGLLNVGPLKVMVRVQDVRKQWGRTDLLVTPTAGTGQQWVSLDRVSDLSA